MAFVVPQLKYAFNALERSIDAITMEIHYSKHHQGYVDNLNKALEDYPELQNKSIDELISQINALPEEIRMTVRNNAGGHRNHTFLGYFVSRTTNSIR